jgi:hypothetical protein
MQDEPEGSYRRYQTPLETLLALYKPQQYLRPGLTLATLQRIAGLAYPASTILEEQRASSTTRSATSPETRKSSIS